MKKSSVQPLGSGCHIPAEYRQLFAPSGRHPYTGKAPLHQGALIPSGDNRYICSLGVCGHCMKFWLVASSEVTS